MYVSGGFRGPLHGHVDNVWRYDVEHDQWHQLASMHTARSYHSMASTEFYIAVVGGVHYRGYGMFSDLQVNVIRILVAIDEGVCTSVREHGECRTRK